MEFVCLVPVVALVATLIALQLGMDGGGASIVLHAAQEGLAAARDYGATDAQGKQVSTDYLHAVAPTLLTGAQVLGVLPGAHWVQATVYGPRERFIPPPGPG